MNKKILFLPQLLILLFWLTWLLPATRPFWDALDWSSYKFLNRLIQTSSFWQNFWAFAGHRMMDWIHDGLMILFFLIPIFRADSNRRARKMAEMLFSALLIGLTITLFNSILFGDYLQFARKSPTLVDEGAFRLSSVISWIKVKDHSSISFPGDHATTAILFACCIFNLMGKRSKLIVFFYSIFFSLPRLITGAHWLTDTLIGSASIALFSTSLAFGTPFATRCIDGIEWLLSIRPSFPKWPSLRKRAPKRQSSQI